MHKIAIKMIKMRVRSRGDERVQCRHHVALVLAQRALRLRLVELHLGGDQVDVRLGARVAAREGTCEQEGTRRRREKKGEAPSRPRREGRGAAHAGQDATCDAHLLDAHGGELSLSRRLRLAVDLLLGGDAGDGL